MLARRRSRPGETSSVLPRGRLTSFIGGVQDLVDALTASLSSSVGTNSRVTSLTRPVRGWQVGLQNGATLDADAVVLAGGAVQSATIVAGLDTSLAAMLAAIPSAPIAVVALGFDGHTLDHPLDGFGFLVPRGEQLPLLGALWDSSIFPNRAPEGHALVRVMLGGARDPQRVSDDDARLVYAARESLAQTMGLRVAPVWTRVIRHVTGIPQYTVGHLDRLAGVNAALSRLPGLFVTGNSYRGVSINACITDARAVAMHVLKR
jgi:protoporphyrinogen/coproporphyrinogen III oxidase